MIGRRLLLFFAAAVLATACGGRGAIFSLSGEDNSAEGLQDALQRMSPRSAPGPVNATGKPLVVVVSEVSGETKLHAFDLGAGRALWTVPADAASKVSIGGELAVYATSNRALVARDIRTGAERWRVPVGGDLVGVAVDAKSVYLAVAGGGDHRLRVLDANRGGERWSATADGVIGAPVVYRGLLWVPFFRQWLVVVDKESGRAIVRLRAEDEQLSFVRADADGVFYGSQRAVYAFDERSASARRSTSTTAVLPTPAELGRAHYHRDAYDPQHGVYSAYDRMRLLWRARSSDGALELRDGLFSVHAFRFLFGLRADGGGVAWAHRFERSEAVTAEHLGDTIGVVTLGGEIAFVDARSGNIAAIGKVSGRAIGATFDADGWRPTGLETGPAKPAATSAALVAIARDRDARFGEIKAFAVRALAGLEGAQATADLIALVETDELPEEVIAAAGAALARRTELAGLEVLAEALERRHDVIERVTPRAIGPAARAVAAVPPERLSAEQKERLRTALWRALSEPEIPEEHLQSVIAALPVVAGEGELGPLIQFLLAYRADPSYAVEPGALATAIDVLVGHGGARERETVSFVADDARSQPSVRSYASRALAQ